MITRPRAAWAAAGVLAVAALAVVPQVGGRSLLPTLQDRNLLVQVQTIPGTSLPEMNRIVAAAGNEVRALPGVARVGAHVGRAVASDQLVNVNSAEMWVTLDGDGRLRPHARRRSRPSCTDTPASGPAWATIQLTASPRWPPARMTTLSSASTVPTSPRCSTRPSRSGPCCRGVSGVARPVVKPVPMQPTADIQVNLATAQRYGLRPGDVRREATTLTSGLIVGNLYEQSKIFDVVVWGAQRTRSDLTQLGNLLIDTPSGGQVPLRDVATVKVHARASGDHPRRRRRVTSR